MREIEEWNIEIVDRKVRGWEEDGDEARHNWASPSGIRGSYDATVGFNSDTSRYEYPNSPLCSVEVLFLWYHQTQVAVDPIHSLRLKRLQ